jgi:gluconokinase
MLVFLFGHPGAGKNYVGEILSKHFGYYFWDADLALTAEMKACIANQEVFTQNMRDGFTQIIIENTNRLCLNPNVVVAQAFFKEKNRRQIAMAFPEAKFILIEANPQTILTRLQLRGNAVDSAYAEKIRAQFEMPRLLYQSLSNNTDENDIIQQLRSFFPP